VRIRQLLACIILASDVDRRDSETATPANFRGLLTSFSLVRYIAWRLSGGRSAIILSLRNGLQLKLRGLQTSDYGLAWDIFWRRCYESPEPLAAVHRVLDLGANVGFSCLWWCHEYPEATIAAFEPHPQHLNGIRWHLAANGLERRVNVIPAAAGTAEGRAWLADAGSSSTVVTSQTGYPIRVADLFNQSYGSIDLLKIDIEG
jgi:FkbM family methyltransferase